MYNNINTYHSNNAGAKRRELASYEIAGISSYDYNGNVIYWTTRDNTGASPIWGHISRILTPEGYIENDENYYDYTTGKMVYRLQPVYRVKDRLGSVRIAFIGDNPSQYYGKTNYYPFGLEMHDTQSDGLYGRYRFNGKEYEKEHGVNWLDYGARWYDNAFDRWFTVDPLAWKYPEISPYVYCANNPVRYIDPDGQDTYIIFYSDGDERFKAAAETRKREIEKSKHYNSETDHVYIQTVGDLGTLADRVNNIVQDAAKNGYGMTVEASFYTHAGVDGPMGDVPTSGKYNLRLETGDRMDDKQLSTTGWQNINWNFDPNNSIATFYGCRSAGFAQRFFDLSNVQYTAGQAGRVGPSYSTDTFNSVGRFARIFGTNRNVYYGDEDNGLFDGVTGYARNRYETTLAGRERKEYYFKGNAGVRKGQIYQYRFK